MEEIIDDAHFIKIKFYALWKSLPKSVKDQEKMLPNDAIDKTAVQNTDFKDSTLRKQAYIMPKILPNKILRWWDGYSRLSTWLQLKWTKTPKWDTHVKYFAYFEVERPTSKQIFKVGRHAFNPVLSMWEDSSLIWAASSAGSLYNCGYQPFGCDPMRRIKWPSHRACLRLLENADILLLVTTVARL